MSLPGINNLNGAGANNTGNGVQGNGKDAFALRNEFLQMMVAQVQNQDPLNPLDGTEYVSQLAQFSMVEGLEYMRQQEQQNGVLLNTMQVLQSSQLVGKQVTVPVTGLTLDTAQRVEGQVAMPEGAEQITLKIYNEFGAVVAEKTWGAGSPDTAFGFDLPAGKYRLEAKAQQDDKTVAGAAYLHRTVEKVSLSPQSGDIQLQLDGIGALSLFSVVEFGS